MWLWTAAGEARSWGSGGTHYETLMQDVVLWSSCGPLACMQSKSMCALSPAFPAHAHRMHMLAAFQQALFHSINKAYSSVHSCSKTPGWQMHTLPASLRLINALADAAKELGCYKVILDCSEANAPFYAKCGFTRKEVQMVRAIGAG